MLGEIMVHHLTSFDNNQVISYENIGHKGVSEPKNYCGGVKVALLISCFFLFVLLLHNILLHFQDIFIALTLIGPITYSPALLLRSLCPVPASLPPVVLRQGSGFSLSDLGQWDTGQIIPPPGH